MNFSIERRISAAVVRYHVVRVLKPRHLLVLLAIVFPAAVLARDSNDDLRRIRDTFHLDQPLPEIEEKVYGSFSPLSGVTADRVSYATAYSLRVPAIVYHPSQRRGRSPALVIVNGHGGDKSSWYAWWAGILYARAGGVVLTYDAIGEFERNHLRMSGTSQHDTYVAPDDMARRMAGLMIEDIEQGVSYLRHRKDVDKGRIAILGYSMGSFISSLACAVEQRAHSCVLVGGGDLDGPGGYWDSSDRKMCQSIPYRSLQFLGDRGAALLALSARRGTTLIYNGLSDKVVDIPNHGPSFFQDLHQRTVARLGGNNKRVFEYQFIAGGGHRPYFVTKPVAIWLNEQLHFPDWSRSSVESMPETHVSEWAAAHHLDMARFSNQVGEGGTMALGTGIPAVNRDLLHALPEYVWESQRDRYVYETWVSAAAAAIRSGTP